jgi:GAF domain-containing protein
LDTDEERTDIARQLAEASALLHSQRTLEDTLDTIVETALPMLPGIDHVGISIKHPDGTVETKAATDPFVWELDSLQYSLNEGPCVDSIQGEVIVTLSEARHAQRWPNYIAQAVRRGLRSQLAVRLFSEEGTLGGLNMYSTSRDDIDPTAPMIAELFATHATAALGRARKEDQLNVAMQTRKLIGQAIGIVMERHQIDEDRAFQYLARVSQTSNIKLRDVAQELISTANERAGRRGPTPG